MIRVVFGLLVSMAVFWVMWAVLAGFCYKMGAPGYAVWIGSFLTAMTVFMLVGLKK